MGTRVTIVLFAVLGVLGGKLRLFGTEGTPGTQTGMPAMVLTAAFGRNEVWSSLTFPLKHTSGKTHRPRWAIGFFGGMRQGPGTELVALELERSREKKMEEKRGERKNGRGKRAGVSQ